MAVGVVVTMMLGGCTTSYEASTAVATLEQDKLYADLAACRKSAVLADEGANAAAGFLGGAFIGAAQGAVFGAIHGGTAEGAVIGATAGAAIGLVIGLFSGQQDLEPCMAAKGWKTR